VNALVDLDQLAKVLCAAVRPWPRRLSEDEAAAYLGISKTTLRDGYQAKPARYPKPERDGRRILWDKAMLDRFVDERSGIVAPSAQADGDKSWDTL
jgi:excisionase family DNA binding protein